MRRTTATLLLLTLGGCASYPWDPFPDRLKGDTRAQVLMPTLPDDAKGIAFSQDGRQFAYASGGVLSVAEVGGQARAIAEVPFGVGQALWTADGQHLVLSEWEQATSIQNPDGSRSSTPGMAIARLVKRRVSDGQATVLAEHLPSVVLPRSTNPRYVAVLDGSAGKRTVRLLDLDTNTLTRLAPDLPVEQLAWSPQGDRVATVGEYAVPSIITIPEGTVTTARMPFPPASPQLVFSWDADGTAIQGANHSGSRVDLTRFPADLSPSTPSTLMFGTQYGYAEGIPTPDGKKILAVRREGTFKNVGLSCLDLASQTVHDDLPWSSFVTWVGNRKFLGRVYNGRETVSYVVTLTE